MYYFVKLDALIDRNQKFFKDTHPLVGGIEVARTTLTEVVSAVFRESRSALLLRFESSFRKDGVVGHLTTHKRKGGLFKFKPSFFLEIKENLLLEGRAN